MPAKCLSLEPRTVGLCNMLIHTKTLNLMQSTSNDISTKVAGAAGKRLPKSARTADVTAAGPSGRKSLESTTEAG